MSTAADHTITMTDWIAKTLEEDMGVAKVCGSWAVVSGRKKCTVDCATKIRPAPNQQIPLDSMHQQALTSALLCETENKAYYWW